MVEKACRNPAATNYTMEKASRKPTAKKTGLYNLAAALRLFFLLANTSHSKNKMSILHDMLTKFMKNLKLCK